MRIVVAAFVLAGLAACTSEEEPVADRYERQKAEIENKAKALEAEVENEVSALEARLDNEADAYLQSVSGNASDPVEAGGNAAAPE